MKTSGLPLDGFFVGPDGGLSAINAPISKIAGKFWGDITFQLWCRQTMIDERH